MTLTENDKLFLQTINNLSKHNRENEAKITIVTNTALLSDDLFELFEVERSHKGGWFFNVYVEFEPMFKEQAAKEWQK